MIRSSSKTKRRDGIILVVVVALLALFAVVGLGYVMYADSSATGSRMSVQSQEGVTERAEVEPDSLLAKVLGSLIYGHYDDQTGVFSASRGHDLARSAYGWNYVVDASGNIVPEGNNNLVAFNGLGRLRQPVSMGALGLPASDSITGIPYNIYDLINYQVHRSASFIRDPEQYPTDAAGAVYRPNPQATNPSAPITLPIATATSPRFFGGANAPYTYPDNNNVYLAAVRAADGQVLIPSFHRPYLFKDPGNPANTDFNFLTNIAHPDWYRPSGRLKLLRPRPIDNLTPELVRELQAAGLTYPPPESIPPGQLNPATANSYPAMMRRFINQGKLMPFPSDAGGDVKNLLGSPGGNDSVWIDIGMPVYHTASGKKYKPLVSYLVTDMDGRINLNMAGNLREGPAGTFKHYSAQGMGRHEINLGKVLNADSVPTPPARPEWIKVFQGYSAGTYVVQGRYDNAASPYYPKYPHQQDGLILKNQALTYFLAQPSLSDLTPFASNLHNDGSLMPPPAMDKTQPESYFYQPPYFKVDLAGTASARLQSLPYDPAKPLTLSSFPNYGYDPTNLTEPLNDLQSDRVNNPLLYNPLRQTGDSHVIDGTEMHKIMGRYEDGTLAYQDSMLYRLLPKNLDNATPQPGRASPSIRHMITLASADLGQPGLVGSTFTTTGTQFVFTPDPSGTLIENHIPIALNGEQFPPLNTIFATNLVQAPNDFAGSAYTFFAPANYPNSTNPVPAGSQQVNTNLVSTLPGGQPGLAYDGRFSAPADPNKPLQAGGTPLVKALGRLDLNRKLSPYPNPTIVNPQVGTTDGAMYYDPNLPQFGLATADRQAFAKEIFSRLRASVGGPALTPAIAGAPPQEKALMRWLAQLAANIVDYIDEDDVMTTFRWFPDANDATNYNSPEFIVLGVEMAKVVLNEVYFELTNGDETPTYINTNNSVVPPTKAAIKYRINVWAELNHTMVPPTVVPADYSRFADRHRALLANAIAGAGTPVATYRLQLIKNPATTALPTFTPNDTSSEDPGTNGQKLVTFANAPTGKKHIDPVDSGAGASSYKNANPANSVAGFYVVGPETTGLTAPATTTLGTNPATFSSDKMWYDVTATAAPQQPATIVLQRLADPYRAPDPNPASPNYNPYVTVDAVKWTPTMTGATNPHLPDPNSVVSRHNRWNLTPAVNPSPAPDTTTKSVMRRQPFAGAFERLSLTQDTQDTPPTQHTMFRHNAKPADAGGLAAAYPEAAGGLERFDWFVHLNRRLTSPIELMSVTGVAPWDVTQKFISANPTNAAAEVLRQGHTAAWTDERTKIELTSPNTMYQGGKVALSATMPTASTRLYRALESFRCGDRSVEMAFGGRDIGKVNINTIWDKEVFDAICDAAPDAAGNPVMIYDAKRGFTQKDVDDVWNAMMSSLDVDVARTANYYVTGTLTLNTQPYSQITASDRPFWGMGAPHEVESAQYPKIGANAATAQPLAGINATLLRKFVAAPTATRKRDRLFESESQFNFSGPPPEVQHPYLEKSMLSKVFEHLTTRSNVFAVYMTVGFFEVTDDSQKPELLGNEMGLVLDSTGAVVENKAIRHRMFAIVDRTNLALQPAVQISAAAVSDDDRLKQGPAPFYYSLVVKPYTNVNPVEETTLVQYWDIFRLPVESVTSGGAGSQVSSVTGSYNGISWSLSKFVPANGPSPAIPGSVLYLGTGAEQRRLAVTSMTQTEAGFVNVRVSLAGGASLGLPPSVPAPWDMTKEPAGKMLITNAIPGNPGPQPDFDHRDPRYRGVVIYSAVLE